jgi:uncharacterized phage-associated protein
MCESGWAMSTSAVSAHDVARELRRRLPGLGDVKTHKLLYYAQGWHLAWTGVPLFEEEIEAWALGPVVSTLWADEKHQRGVPVATELSGQALATIEYVVGRYGRFSGKELIRKTHLEDPWRDVSESEDSWMTANPEISQKAMQRWFEQDDDYVAHGADASRLQQRSDVYSFDAPPLTDSLRGAVERAITGQRVVDSPA